MTIFQFKQYFVESLQSIYSKEESVTLCNLLLESRLGWDVAEIVLNGKQTLTNQNQVYFEKALQRLLKNEPIQHLIGYTDFYGLKIKVNPFVLVPRSETEELVDWILKDVKSTESNKPVRILDIGTGSGCIAISLAKNLSNYKIQAIDISEEALQIAKENALRHKVNVKFVKADIFDLKEADEKFDIIVSNPPYVRDLEKTEMHFNVSNYDPEMALFVRDEDPLIFYNAIADYTKKMLSKNGKLYFEINQYLGKEMIDLLQKKGFKSIRLKKDLLGNDRMIQCSYVDI
jgi:release factor glutamine methyltransferase